MALRRPTLPSFLGVASLAGGGGVALALTFVDVAASAAFGSGGGMAPRSPSFGLVLGASDSGFSTVVDTPV